MSRRFSIRLSFASLGLCLLWGPEVVQTVGYSNSWRELETSRLLAETHIHEDSALDRIASAELTTRNR